MFWPDTLIIAREHFSDGAADLCLASASPRRRELLSQLGVKFHVLEPRIDERHRVGESPADFVRRLALGKAAHVSAMTTAHALPTLGADTVVSLGEAILMKPANADDAVAMLLGLSGVTHSVYTGVALHTAAGVNCLVSRSHVTFRKIERAEALRYWDTGEPCDKAGGYAIQGFGVCFVAHLEGSYSGVVGLPLYETAQLLDAARVPRWTFRADGSGHGTLHDR